MPQLHGRDHADQMALQDGVPDMWPLGDLPVSSTGSRSLVLRVDGSAAVGTPLVQRAELTAPLTVAPPALVTTLVG